MRPNLSKIETMRSVKYSHIQPNTTSPSDLMNYGFTMRNTLTEKKLKTSSKVDKRRSTHSFQPQEHNTNHTG